MTIYPISTLDDNYVWVLVEQNHVAVVCPGEAQPVLDFIADKQLTLDAILVTHNHWDHVDGIEGIKAQWPDADVYGPANEFVPHKTVDLKDGDQVSLFNGLVTLNVWDIPGHTAGHIAFLGEGYVFCGDTIFSAGCGRIFNGTIEQLYESIKRLRELPDYTLIYCAHEYTIDNLGFAEWTEPNNQAVTQYLSEVESKRRQNLPSVPSSMAVEKAINPFLRFDVPEVIASVQKNWRDNVSSEAAVFAALRQWKDQVYDRQ